VTRGTRGSHPDPERLDAYADGDHGQRDVRAHVEDCPVCAETVAALRRVRGDLARLAEITMPDEMLRRLRALADPTASDRRSDTGDRDGTNPGVGNIARAPNAGGVPRPAPGPDGRVGTETPQDGAPGRGPAIRRPAAAPGPRPGRHTRRSRRPMTLGPGAAGFVPASRPAAQRSSDHPGGDGPRGGRDGSGLVAVAAALLVVLAIGGAVLSRGGTAARSAADTPPTTGGGLSQASVTTGTGSAGYAAAAPADGSARPGTETVSLARTNAALDATDAADHGAALLSGRPRPLAAVSAAAALAGTLPARLSARVRAALADLTGPDLVRCYDIIMSRYGGRLLALDEVTFNSAPAALLVLSVPGDQETVRVLVVDEACAGARVSQALWYGALTDGG